MNTLSQSSSPDLLAFWENEVRPRLRVEDVYSAVEFSRRDDVYWRGKCPLHGGGDDNFSVHTGTLSWTCFSRCGHGSALGFLNGGEEPRGAQWVEAVRKLSAHAGIAFPERNLSPDEMQRIGEKQRRSTLLETFHQLSHQALHSDGAEKARAYLEARGVAADQWQAFGFCPSFIEVKRQLIAAGFTENEIASSGLLRDTRWEGRILLAWRDHRGEIGTFAARDINENTSDSKYLYLSTQNGWARKKSDLLLFGLDIALNEARRAGFLLIVEGLFDALSLQTRGLKNVAAIGGGGQELSAARLEKLAALGVEKIVLLLDNDPHDGGSWPGLDGSVSLIENVRNSDNVPVIDVIHPKVLGSFKDPDSLVRSEGIEALSALLDRRETGAAFLARHLLEGISPRSSEATRRDALDTILKFDRTLHGARAALDREDVLAICSQFTGYSRETLQELAEDWEARRARQQLEKQIDAALRDAQKQRSSQTPALEVVALLGSEIAALRALAIDTPPLFSVERLERESTVIQAGKRAGWKSLDDLDVRFNAGELAVLAARTGHGKTSALVSLLVNWLRPLATEWSDEVFVLYSAEEPEIRIYHRMLALLSAQDDSGWTVAQVRDFLRDPYSRGADYSWPDPALLAQSREFLTKIQRNLQIVYRPGWNVSDIEAHARALHKRHPLGAIMVDYLQRIPPPPGRFDRRDQEVSAIGRRLKSLAVDVATPIVAGAQINRESIPEGHARNMSGPSYETAKEALRKARPELHHLREGGSEQEADLILGLLNLAADYRGPDRVPPASLLEIGVLKNRYGEAGKWARLAFEGRYGAVREPRYGEAL